MAENKTRETKASVAAFLNAIDDKRKRADAKKVAAMMRKATGKRARAVDRQVRKAHAQTIQREVIC